MISIIVPTLGRPSLAILLESVEAAARRDGLNHVEKSADLEIIISVDPSDPEAFSRVTELVQRFPAALKVMHAMVSDGPGVNRARNAGARRSRGEILWFLDDDIELPKACRLRDLPQIFGNMSTVAAGGHYISHPNSTLIERGYNALCSTWRASAGHDDQEQLLGGTLAVRRWAWEAAGGFNEAIVYGGSETSFVNSLRDLAHEGTKSRIEFREELNVIHAASHRPLRRWLQVAIHQGRRKSTSQEFLPGSWHRVARAFGFLRQQDWKTIGAFVIFSVPFLMASFSSRWFGRQALPSRD